MTKRIVLCADDYGQAPNISAAILALLDTSRLSATSCMVNTSYWLHASKGLRPYLDKADIGLHFNLTQGKALSREFRKLYGDELPTLGDLLRRSFFRQLRQSVIEAECDAQINRFVDAMGTLPAFIDGHQHSHQFPVIRQAVVQVYKRRLITSGAYIRLANPRLTWHDWQQPKKVVIVLSGAAGMQKLLDENHIPRNQSFSGVYPFSRVANYRQYFQSFLAEITDGGLILCHPGLLAEERSDDSLGVSRNVEYKYLSGDQFPEDCAAAGVTIARFDTAR
jgi:chitin disaccharide deacetylase